MKPFYFFVLFFVCTSCNQKKPTDSKTPDIVLPAELDLSLAGSFSRQEELFLDSGLIQQFFVKHPLFNDIEKEVKRFYKNKKYALAWFDSDGLTVQAEHLYNRISNMQEEGVGDTLVYYSEMIRSMEACYAAVCDLELDVMLTAQYIVYSKRITEGLPENISMEQEWFIPRETFSLESLLDSLSKKTVSDLLIFEPQYFQYRLLRNQLKGYKSILAIEKKEPFTRLQGRFELGDSAATIGTIKRKLYLLGDLESADSSLLFDATFETAARSFQKRHGLMADGIIGKSFMEQINIPTEDRIKQIIVNMERCRWFSKNPDGEFLLVNIPEYKLHAFKGDSLYWSMKVVVGRELRETVVFTGEISMIVFSPYWNIPPGILQKDVLPMMAKDSNYLVKHNMEIVGWDGKLPRIRERPSEKNPLGKVKFLFPNKFSIYLHDSPSRSLFEKDQRTFSSGCIRLENAEKLTRFLLKEQKEWNDSLISLAMNANKERYVKLKKQMPVFITYFTSWVDEEGMLNFRKDIYDRDKALEKMIFQN